MPAPASLDWLFTTLGYTLAAAGALLLLWSLFWDRSRGRRRCPKCWYDMAGIPGLRCPECGRDARRERGLQRTKRRWRRAAASTLLLCGGIVTERVPAYRDGGYVRVIPGCVLVFIAPPTFPGIAAFLSSPARGFGTMTLGAPPIVTQADRLSQETWSRLYNGYLAQWQSQYFLGRYFQQRPKASPDHVLTFPARWPAGVPLAARGGQPLAGLRLEARLPGGGWTDVSDVGQYNTGDWVHRLAPGPRDAERPIVDLRLCAADRVVYTRQMAAPTHVNGSPTSFLTPLDSPKHNAMVLAALRPVVVRVGEKLVVSFHERSSEAVWKQIDFGVYFTAELRVGGVALARGAGRTDWSANTWSGELGAELASINGANLSEVTGPLELIVRGDPGAAGERYMANPFQRPSAACWTGELVVSADRVEVRSP